jgi:CubicO group peptidase (beta-lactamase class C family)
MNIMKKTKTRDILIFLVFIFALFSVNGFITGEVKPEIEKLEKGLLPPVLVKGEQPYTLSERMAFYKVPGVSIAVIKDFKVEWTKGYGVLDTTTKVLVNEVTLFQAASVSKPVAAMAIFKEFQDGKLNLDANVNDILVSWKLPDNEFTANKKVTIKNLLSHTGGTTVHGFRGHAPNETIPTLIQVLNGEKPANSAPVVVDTPPGLRQRYSGGGYCILQQVSMDIEKKPFPAIMDKLVLKPLGMTHSTYMQPLPADMQKNASSGHRTGGLRVEGKWHIYPEMAAAGLWTTSEDLAKFVTEIQQAFQGKPANVFSQKTAQLMLSPYLSPYSGLGVFLDWRGKSVYFNHGGSNEGFTCFFIGHKEKGYGAVVMTNSDDGPELYAEILRGIANIYQWDDYLPPVYEVIKIDPVKLKPCAGKFAIDSDHMLNVTFDNDRLYAVVTSAKKAELFPISGSKFIRRDERVVYEFINDPNTNTIVQLVVERNGIKRTYERKGDDYTVPLEILLSGKIEAALDAYRKLKEQNPSDPNIQGIRLLFLAEELIGEKYLKEALAVIHLTAELYPELIKSMHATLNNEMKLYINNPTIPDEVKKQLKESYNSMLKKLGLKELE